jgi:hypothetical protein
MKQQKRCFTNRHFKLTNEVERKLPTFAVSYTQKMWFIPFLFFPPAFPSWPVFLLSRTLSTLCSISTPHRDNAAATVFLKEPMSVRLNVECPSRSIHSYDPPRTTILTLTSRSIMPLLPPAARDMGAPVGLTGRPPQAGGAWSLMMLVSQMTLSWIWWSKVVINRS